MGHDEFRAESNRIGKLGLRVQEEVQVRLLILVEFLGEFVHDAETRAVVAEELSKVQTILMSEILHEGKKPH